jgi:hypothetical protein
LASVSAIVILLAVVFGAEPPASQAQTAPHQNKRSASKFNETRLAGLVPGRTTLRRARAIIGQAGLDEDTKNHVTTWIGITGPTLEIETNERDIVVSVRLEHPLEGWRSDALNALPDLSKWKTSRGLALWSSSKDVLRLYGKPDSVSPSTKGGQQLELWYYAFDWAGPDVPQVMEVVCTVAKNGNPGRVVEITLAASSL